MPGIKHLIECHCYLAIYKNSKKLINHKFPVYSKLDENNNVISKIFKCNNCEALHNVVDIGKSELIPGKDQTQLTLTKEELSLMIPNKIKKILDEYESDISNYDHVIDIIEEKRWGEFIVLKRDVIDENENVKILTINSKDKIKISTETINNTVIKRENNEFY
jgi:hypothetical protein